MLYGLEIINRPKKTPRIYFRFLDENGNKSEVCYNEKKSIEKAVILAVTKDDIQIEYDKDMERVIKKVKLIDEGPDKIAAEKLIKTEEFKSNLMKSARDRLETAKKVKQGKDDFSIFIKKMMNFTKETFESIK